MSNITAKVVLDSAQAQAGLDKLNDKIKQSNEGFAKFGSILSGLAVGSFIKSAFDMADAMADVAEATEMSIAQVTGFGKAVAASGGSVEGASKSLLKFTENIGGAAEGSASLQNAFFQVGVSLQDIQKLSSQDLLSKTLEGLSKVSDVSARLKLQSDLLGKGFKGVNVSGVNDSYAAQTAASQASAAASAKAAAAVDKFNATIQTMREQVLVALTPVIDAFNKLPTEQIAAFTKALVYLIGAFAAIKVASGALSVLGTLGSTFTKGINGIATAFAGVSSAVSNSKGGVVTLGETWNRLGYQMKAVTRDFKAGTLTMDVLSNKTLPILGTRLSYATKGIVALSGSIVKGVGAALAGIGGLVLGFASLVLQILAVNEIVSAITGFDFIDTWAKKLESFVKTSMPSLYNAIDSLGKKMGMADINGKPQGPAADVPPENTAAGKAAEETNRAIVDSLGKQKVEFAKILSDYKEANDLAFKKYNLETDMIGKSAEQQAIMQMTNEQEIQYLNTKKALQEKIDSITKGGSAQEKADLLPGLIAEQKELTAEYNKQKDAIEGQVAARMKADAADRLAQYRTSQQVSMNESLTKLEQARANVFLPEIKKQYNDIEAAANASAAAQIAAEEARTGKTLSKDEISAYYAAARQGVEELTKATTALNEEQNKFQLHLFGIQQEIDATNSLNKIQDDMATMTMPEIEKKYYDIAAAARDSAKAAVEAEEARRGAKLDPAEAQQYYDKAYAGVNKLTSATKKQWEMSRSFETGWKKAMNSYIDEATNAATKAEKLFTTACKGMEDAIVGFAKTGKFEWKSFVSDMLEQLLRSQVQGVFANLMGSITGSLSSATQSSQNSASQDTGIMSMIGSLFGGGSSSGSGITGNQGSPVYVTNWPGGAAGGLSSILGGGTAAGGTGATQGGGIWDSITTGAGDLWDTVTGWFGGGSAAADKSGIGTASSLMNDIGRTQDTGSQDQSWFGDIASSVGDIASSIGDWFGGFFATGGQIPSGKIGIVGERGPEFIGGPANITPMGTGTAQASQNVTNVYYTINATDPQSFKQQLASDPGFVHGLVMSAANGMAV